MDPRLAEMYGTNLPDEDDLEKMASAVLAESLADEGQIDLADLDPDALEALAEEVLGGEGADEGADDGEGADLEVDQEKLAEADFLGRAMAHAYVAELRGIEKEAAAHPVKYKGLLRRAGQAVGDAGSSVAGAAKGAAGKASWGGAALGSKVENLAKTNPKAALALGGAAALAAGAGAGRMSKQSSAFDTLVMQRAEEILAENGIELEKEAAKKSDVSSYTSDMRNSPARGSLAVRAKSTAMRHGRSAVEAVKRNPKKSVGLAAAGLAAAGAAAGRMSKQSSAEDFEVLGQAVEQQAWELLAANGFVSEE